MVKGTISSHICGVPVTEIANDAASYVYNEDLFNVIIPNTVTKIGDCAFQCAFGPKTDNSGLGGVENLYIPKSVTKVGNSSLYECCQTIYYEGTEEDWNLIEGLEESGLY
jgi:hypothetical protein